MEADEEILILITPSELYAHSSTVIGAAPASLPVKHRSLETCGKQAVRVMTMYELERLLLQLALHSFRHKIHVIKQCTNIRSIL